MLWLALAWASPGTAGLTGSLRLSGTITGVTSTQILTPSRAPASLASDNPGTPTEFEVARIFQRSNASQGYEMYLSGQPASYALSLNSQPIAISGRPVLVHSESPSDKPSAATYVLRARQTGLSDTSAPSVLLTVVAR